MRLLAQTISSDSTVNLIAWQRRFSDLLLSSDPNRRTMIAMALLAIVLMAGSAGVVLFLEHSGVIRSYGVAPWWAALSLGGLVVMTGLIRCGWSSRLRDPSMSLLQMAWTITSGAVAYVFAGEARGMVPSVLAMILFFGALGLNLTQVITIGLYSLVVFALAVVISTRLYAEHASTMDIAYGWMILIVLSGCMVLNLRIHRIRQNLRDQRTQLARALAVNRELALRDELTGLLNRRAAGELIALELRRKQRNRGPLLLAMIDLDHFKTVNDEHGHVVGDQALRAFANMVRTSVRDTDVLARWGGDEFLLMLSDAPLHEGERLLKRACKAVESLQIEVEGNGEAEGCVIGLSMSAGLAECLDGETMEQTIERADKALYIAKAQGRNCVAVARTLPGEAQESPSVN